MVGLVSFSIVQVRDGERRAAGNEIVHTSQPKRLKVEQVAGVFLSGPLSWLFPHQDFLRPTVQSLFHPRRCAAQTRCQIRVKLDRERKLEFPFKPDWYLAHPIVLPQGLGLAQK